MLNIVVIANMVITYVVITYAVLRITINIFVDCQAMMALLEPMKARSPISSLHSASSCNNTCTTAQYLKHYILGSSCF